jgi:hypothetical protein
MVESFRCFGVCKVLDVFETEIVGLDAEASKTVLLVEDTTASSQFVRGGAL